MNRSNLRSASLALVVLLLSSITLEAETGNTYPQRLGGRWIGVTTAPASTALRAQLALPNNQGIVVRAVTPNSPAAKAGLRTNDLLLTIDNKILARPRDLSRMIGQSDRPRFAIEVLRGGRKQRVFVEPVARRKVVKSNIEGSQKRQRPIVQALLNQLDPTARTDLSKTENANEDEGILSSLPKNFQITLRRDAGGPPRFLVEREGRRWEMNASNLGQWGQALMPLAGGLLGNASSPPPAPVKKTGGASDTTIPKASVPLPKVELPSELIPLEPLPQDANQGATNAK